MSNIVLKTIADIPEDWKLLKKPPKDYRTIYGIAKDWKISSHKIKRIIHSIGTLRPNKFINEQGAVNQYYSPQDIDAIYDIISDYMSAKKAPKGWMVIRQMALKWNINEYTVRQAVQKLDKTGRLECKKCLDNKRCLRFFYSPKATAIIYDMVFSTGKVPEGYMSARQIGKAWGISESKIIKTIKKLDNLERITLGFGKKMKRVYYSPKAIKTIRRALRDFSLIEQAPDNWRTTYQMAEDFGVSANAIHGKLKKLKGLEVRKYKNPHGVVYPFYSPDAIKVIHNSLNRPKPPLKPKIPPQIPDDWISDSKIASNHNVSMSAVKKAVEKLDNLDSTEYCGRRETEKIYYSPKSAAVVSEAVELLKSDMKAPNGWRTMTMIANELSVTIPIIQHRIIQLNNLEIRRYLDYRNSVQPFYSPDAFKAIRRALVTEQAPDGWKTVPQMALDFNVTRQTIHYHIKQMENPESKKFRREDGRVCSFYSPDIVTIVRKSIKLNREDTYSS